MNVIINRNIVVIIISENSQLECGELDVDNGTGSSYRRLGVFQQTSLIRKHDLWSKVKEAVKRHCNEYRMAIRGPAKV